LLPPVRCFSDTASSRGTRPRLLRTECYDAKPLHENESLTKIQVQYYAARNSDERPIRFQLGNRDYMVEEVLDQWYGPDDEFFKVRAEDGNLYIVRHQGLEDEWSLESFRQTAR
jgi:hypothetical protein